MRKVYDKLVRDRIPEIIRREGRRCGVEVMSERAYVEALRDKLVEEAQEASTCVPERLVEELADLCEVIDSLVAATGTDPVQVRAKQEQRRLERGGFNERLRLLWVEEIE